MARLGWMAVAAWMASACTASGGPAADAALDAPLSIADAAADGARDAQGADAACLPGCHWDCFGGSECVAGVAWVNGFAPRSCCTFSDPWPGPGPVCSAYSHRCEGATCVTPDPRYRACLQRLGTRAEWCYGATCEHLLLYCPEGAVKRAGAPCAGDGDCRPAADGVTRLRCDTASTHNCVVDARPAAPAGYGASCGLTADQVSWLQGEAVVSYSSASCGLCQVARGPDGCLRQGCTTACSFDEDCPSGSVCLCGDYGSPVVGYCAAATDRDTAAGRAAGLPACQSP